MIAHWSGRAADVDAVHLLLFQSQEVKHARNSSDLSDWEAWSATLLLIQQLSKGKLTAEYYLKKLENRKPLSLMAELTATETCTDY